MRFNLSKKYSILRMLFVPYTLIFIFFYVLVSVFFVSVYSRKVRDDAFASVKNNLIMVTDTLNTEVNILDTLSQNIIYSNLVKDSFESYLYYELELPAPEEIDTYTKNQNIRNLFNTLFAILGPNHPADQIYLYGIDGGTFGTGLDNSSGGQSVTDKAWYEKTMDLHGGKNIFVEKNVLLSPYYSNGGDYFLTLTRAFYDTHNTPQGVVEIKKNLSDFLSVIQALDFPGEAELLIYDEDQNPVYPFTSSENTETCLELLEEHETSTDETNYIYTAPNYYFYSASSSTGFTTVITINKNTLFSTVYSYIATSLLVLLLICLFVITVSYYIARRISRPITNMYTQVRDFQLNDNLSLVPTITLEKTSVLELQVLNEALVKMQHKIQQSVQRELQLQQRESQAKMLALQAQMNPHFLFNSLAVIQALSDEKENGTINIFCRNISNILRYISADEDQLVELEKELLHTDNYLQCMKIRYGSYLSYSIDVPDEMYSLRVPKLCLQMLSENAIKYSTKIRAPWKISITGRLGDQGWDLKIRDNGPGFSEDILKYLNEKMDEIISTDTYPELKIDGMGLMNTFIRFKIIYKGNFIFRLDNCEPQGAVVTIGGSL